jgi:hypothetical protein
MTTNLIIQQKKKPHHRNNNSRFKTKVYSNHITEITTTDLKRKYIKKRFEYNKEVIRRCKSKDRQLNGQRKGNNDQQQNITHEN